MATCVASAESDSSCWSSFQLTRTSGASSCTPCSSWSTVCTEKGWCSCWNTSGTWSGSWCCVWLWWTWSVGRWTDLAAARSKRAGSMPRRGGRWWRSGITPLGTPTDMRHSVEQLMHVIRKCYHWSLRHWLIKPCSSTGTTWIHNIDRGRD